MKKNRMAITSFNAFSELNCNAPFSCECAHLLPLITEGTIQKESPLKLSAVEFPSLPIARFFRENLLFWHIPPHPFPSEERVEWPLRTKILRSMQIGKAYQEPTISGMLFFGNTCLRRFIHFLLYR